MTDILPSFPSLEEPDLVPGTRIMVQSLPPPLNGRSAKIVDYDRASQAYIVHVDGGNPRTLYRENLRILEDQSVPLPQPKRATGRPQATRVTSSRERSSAEMSSIGHHQLTGNQIRSGDQILLCIEQHQFTLMEVTGIRRVCKSEPQSFAIAAILDDGDVPAWMRKPPPQAASRSKGLKGLPGFRIGDAVYAVWDQDGRWYPGRIREEYTDKFEIEWLDKDASPSLVKKNMVCKRTSFDDLRSRPNYIAALNLASRTGGTMKGLKGAVMEDEGDDDEFMDRVKSEEVKRKAEAASTELFGARPVESEMSQDDWNTVINAMKILNKYGVDGLTSSKRGEVFHVPPKFAKEEEANWDMEASNSLHAWLTEGQVVKTSLTLPPSTTNQNPILTSPARAALEASIVKAWPGRPGVALPRGPLDIFQKQ
jgi:hypothetical protein